MVFPSVLPEGSIRGITAPGGGLVYAAPLAAIRSMKMDLWDHLAHRWRKISGDQQFRGLKIVDQLWDI